MYGFVVASNDDLEDLEGKVDELLKQRLTDSSVLRHFDEGLCHMYTSLFVSYNCCVETYGNMIRLPKYMRALLAAEDRLITEETPLYICDL
jgi:hypothetical protein